MPGQMRSPIFTGIHITSFRDKADVAATVSWTEANEKLFGFEYTDYADCPVTNLRIIAALASFLVKLMAMTEISRQKTNILRWP